MNAVYLALDFDGVLHPAKSWTEPKFCRLEMLEAWLREHPDVEAEGELLMSTLTAYAAGYIPDSRLCARAAFPSMAKYSTRCGRRVLR